MMFHRRAFTLIELAIVVVIAAIIAVAARPDPDAEARQQAEMAADLIASDVAFARSLAITSPDDPVVIRFDPPNNQYWVAKASNENLPVLHPVTKKALRRCFGAGTRFGRVTLLATDVGGDSKLSIDSTGRFDQDTQALVQLTADSKEVELDLSPNSMECKVSNQFSKTLTAVAPPEGGK